MPIPFVSAIPLPDMCLLDLVPQGHQDVLYIDVGCSIDSHSKKRSGNSLSIRHWLSISSCILWTLTQPLEKREVDILVLICSACIHLPSTGC